MAHSFKQGEVHWVNLSPTAGHEQRGKRPAIVVSNNDFNAFTNLVMAVPVTTNMKDFPLHLELPKSMKTKGKALIEHQRSIDLAQRDLGLIEICPEEFTEDILEAISELY